MGGRDERFQGHKTSPGYAAPDEPVVLDRAHDSSPAANVPATVPKPAKVPRQPSPPPPRHPALYTAPPPEHLRVVEVEVLHETGAAPGHDVFDRSVEVWTQNHVYVLDPQMVCTGVRAVANGQSVTSHELLGTRLVGGQLDGVNDIQLSYPFPAPGSTAVFQATRDGRMQYSRTSAVNRVVLRQHILTVKATEVIPTWKEITGPRHGED